MQVIQTKKNKNPFYGFRNCLLLLQASTQTWNECLVNASWNEVKNNEDAKKLFWSILFSIGDVTARQHNIFKGIKKDNGGNANRETFFQAMEWTKRNHWNQFVKFLNAGLFNEYTCFDNLFRSRVQTKGKNIISTTDVFSDKKYREVLASYIYSIVNGTNEFNKLLVAKFLTLPRLSKRSGHKKMLDTTYTIMLHKALFLQELSKLCGWEYEFDGKSIANFKGYREWRKKYNKDLESVLFSTGAIKDMTEDHFLKWFDALPSQARFRVKNRILYGKNEDESPKYPRFQEWYKKWEQYKEKKQQEQRDLEEKIRQDGATEADLKKLEKVKKQAKVNVGATSFKELFDQICRGRIDPLKLETFMTKINLPYNSLVILDESGSMVGEPFNFAVFLATVCMMKNPDDEARNLVGMFSHDCHWYSHIDAQSSQRNRLLSKTISQVSSTPLIDPHKSFIENYNTLFSFLRSKQYPQGTNISAIPASLERLVKSDPEMIETLQNYPVWTIITDGEWNNMYSPEASINDFFRRCEKILGFKPYVIAIDVQNKWYSEERLQYGADRFSGIDNLMYIPSNPALIEQFLTNFDDMDVYDVYTPLQSMFRTNRYELVREYTL